MVEVVMSSIETYGLLAIALVVLIKSAGVPIPVPNDALLLLGAASVAEGRQALLPVFSLLLAALVVGSLLQYWCVSGPARGLLDRIGPRFGLTPYRLNRVAGMLERGGLIGLSFGVVTPGLRSLTIVAAGLSRLPMRLVAPGLLLGNAAFLALHFVLAIIGLAALRRLFEALPLPGLILLALIAVGGAGWLAIGLWQRPRSMTGPGVAEAVGAWHEACCPVCLLLGAVVIRPENRVETGVPEAS